MTDYHVKIFYSGEDGGYIADIPDLDSCSAFGETPEKALAEVEQAKEPWIAAAHADSLAASRFVEYTPIDLPSGYSMIRMKLLARLARGAVANARFGDVAGLAMESGFILSSIRSKWVFD